MLTVDLIVNIPCYVLVNHYVASQGVSHPVAWALDYQIPFLPAFSIFYALVYVFPVICFLFIWDSYPLIKAAFKAFLAMGLICLTCFVIYPVEFQLRPEMAAPYGFFEQLVRFFYWADSPPFNCLPSLHVAGAFMSARMVWLHRRKLGYWFFGIAVMITLSTLFIRQHYLIDVFGGLAVYGLVGALFLPKEVVRRENLPVMDVEWDGAE